MRPNNLLTLRRRHALASLGALGFAPALARAQTNREHRATPAQTLGPFYPRAAAERPPQTDNDLLVFDGDRLLTRGVPLFLTGHVVSKLGPVTNARVEIWQCDANAVYHHPAGGAEAERDRNFQGYGETRTDRDGAFYFRTIQPVPYPGRTAHIHVRIEANGFAPLSTQLYLANEAGNARDFLYRQLNDAERTAVTLSLRPTEAAHPLARGTRVTAEVDLVVA
jgi:protocatechuate 3,4-dioxygenase beta subunit